jgi:hypothetical protein
MRGLCIPLLFIGDKGGDSTKFQMSTLARKTDGHYYRSLIAMYQGSEDHHIICNTVGPTINTGIEQLKGLNILIIEWADGFDNKFAVFDVLMNSLLSIRYFLYAPSLTDDEMQLAKTAFTDFGKIWRRDLQLPVPIKLHILEEHAFEQLQGLGSIGLFLEETMESAHKDDNILNRMYANIKDWAMKDKAKLVRTETEKACHSEYLESKLRVKRTYAASINEEHKAKKEDKVYQQQLKVQRGVHNASMHLNIQNTN